MKTKLTICFFTTAFLFSEIICQTIKKAPQKAKTDAVFVSSCCLKVECLANFPGGCQAWERYIDSKLNYIIPLLNAAAPGNYYVIINFSIDRTGVIDDAKAVTNFGFGMEAEAIRVIMASPNWSPATHNGRNVKEFRKQVFFFTVPEPIVSTKVKNLDHDLPALKIGH